MVKQTVFFRFGPRSFSIIKIGEKVAKAKKTTAKVVVFVVDDIGLELQFLPGRKRLPGG